MRIGHGYDVHRLEEGRDFILGGCKIEYKYGLKGHSDADVLVHAIMDALLGASANGDIGRHFPDTDKSYEGANSLKLLSKVCDMVKEKGYKISNIDSTIIAQAPKIAPYIGLMRKNIANACKIEEDQINVKATTEEGLGFTGEMKGVSAHAVCVLEST